jgi:hypothetical protein
MEGEQDRTLDLYDEDVSPWELHIGITLFF